MCSKNEKIILQWFTAVVKKDIKVFKDLKDGKVLYDTLQLIKPIDYGSICSKPEKSISTVFNKLKCRFRTNLDYINVDKAKNGDEKELENVVMLVLVAGLLSDSVQDFIAPISNFDPDDRLIIKNLINDTVKPNMDLKDRLLDVSFEGRGSGSDSPNIDSDNSFTQKDPLSFVSPILPNNFKLSKFISPTINPFTPIKDTSFNTKMMQTEQRLDNLTTKLKSEKSLRSEIEEELNQKDDEIERRMNEVDELNERLKEMERRKNAEVEKLMMQVTSLERERELEEEKKQEVQERETQKEKERKDLKEANVVLERQNTQVFEEKNQLQEAHTKQCTRIQLLTTQLQQDTHSNLQLQEEMSQKTEQLQEVTLRLAELQKLYDEEAEFFNDKLQVMTDKLNKSVSIEEGECWGDVVERALKDEVEELQTTLQTRNEQVQEVKADNERLQSQITSGQLALQEAVQKQAEGETRVGVLKDEKCSLEGKLAVLEGLLSEEEERHQGLKREFEENEKEWNIKWNVSEEKTTEMQVVVETLKSQLEADKAQLQASSVELTQVMEKEKATLCQNESLQMQISQLENIIGALKEDKDKLNVQVSEGSEREHELVAVVDDLNKDVENKLMQITVLEKNAFTLQKEAQQKQELLDETTNKLQAVSSLHTILQEQLRQQTSQIEVLTSAQTKDRGVIDEMTSDLQEVTTSLNTMTSLKDELSNELVVLQEGCQELKSEVDRLQDDLKDSSLKHQESLVLITKLEVTMAELNEVNNMKALQYQSEISERLESEKVLMAKCKESEEVNKKNVKEIEALEEKSLQGKRENEERLVLITSMQENKAQLSEDFKALQDKLQESNSKLSEVSILEDNLQQKLKEGEVNWQLRLDDMEVEILKLKEENTTVLKRVSGLECSEMKLKKEVEEKDGVLKTKCAEYDEMVVMKGTLDGKVKDLNQALLVLQKDKENIVEVEEEKQNLINKVALLEEGESRLTEENKCFMSRIVSLQENEATLKGINDLMAEKACQLREESVDNEEQLKTMQGNQEDLHENIDKLNGKLTETQERLVVVEEEKDLLRMSHENNQKEMKKQVEEMTDALKKTMVHDSKHFSEDADVAVMKWTEMGTELEQGRLKLKKVVEAGTLNKDASVFESLQQARQLTDVFVQMFDLLKHSHQLHKQELKLKEKEVKVITKVKKTVVSSKKGVTNNKGTREPTKKDGAWNNYGAPQTEPSKPQKNAIVTNITKIKPELGKDRRMTRVIDKSSRKGEESSVVMVNSPALDKEASNNRKSISLPKGFGPILNCEDEPEQPDWKQLERSTKCLTEKPQTRAATADQNIFKKPNSLHVLSTNKQTGRKKLFPDSVDRSRDTLFINQIPEKPEDDNVDRISEIKRRNTLCLPHLRSTYPLETLTCNANVLPSPVQSSFSSNHQKTSTTALIKNKPSPRKRPHTTSLQESPALVKNFKTLKVSEQNNNVLQDSVEKKSSKRRSVRSFLHMSNKTLDQKSTSSDSSSLTEQEHKENVAFNLTFTPKRALKKILGYNKKKKLIENVDK